MSPRTAQASPMAKPCFPILTGFDGTEIYGTGKNLLQTTQHDVRFDADLALVKRDGMDTFRATISWPQAEPKPGVYDWTWIDAYLASIQRHGLLPIVDLLHHTSIPHWIPRGFWNPHWPERYARFVRAFARRYPWVTWYTPVNEPFATAWLAGHEAIWHPNMRGHIGYVLIALNMARAICMVTEMLIEEVPGVRFLHTDSCEHHQALDRESEYHADKSNEMRFSVLDLILGTMEKGHYLYTLFREQGMTSEDVSWFKDHPARVDVLGLDYYAVHEAGWNKLGRSEDIVPLGLKTVALQYADRYARQISRYTVSEANLRGYVTDRLTWLKYTTEECIDLVPELQARGLSFEGYCWYPYIDTTDWCSMVCQANGNIDPQGIYWLSEGTLDRNASELSECYAALAKGTMQPHDLPAYVFDDGALDVSHARKFLPLMRAKGWDWKVPEHPIQVAA